MEQITDVGNVAKVAIDDLEPAGAARWLARGSMCGVEYPDTMACGEKLADDGTAHEPESTGYQNLHEAAPRTSAAPPASSRR